MWIPPLARTAPARKANILASRNEHLIVIPVKPYEIGVEFEEWPLHITIVPWFPCDDENKLDTLLLEIASRHKAFEVSPGEVTYFGEKKELPINLINDSDNLYKLHRDVFYSLEQNGFPVHQKNYLGPNYKPHVTSQGYKSVRAGEKIIVNRFSLVAQVRQKQTGTMIKKVVKEYSLR